MLDDRPQITISGSYVGLEDVVGRVGVDLGIGAGECVASLVVGLVHHLLHVGNERVGIEHHLLESTVGEGVPS